MKATRIVYKYHDRKMILKHGAYHDNGRLAVVMEDVKTGETYGIITVNLPNATVHDSSCAYVDVNNFPDIQEFLTNQVNAVYTGQMARSGYCVYPEYRFNVSTMERV